ncbi:arsenate reductase (glutaredoxin) [Rhodobacteraceae bacterium KMM 6894]|nr:arsenate reductase (glutaredoxin) [Rhodobacteraceae bacterium KMM 6894]
MIKLWHNPRCSKSRAALALLEAQGVSLTVRRYLDDAPDVAELRRVQALLQRPVIDMMRTGEPAFKAAGLTRDTDEATLLAAMAAHPILIERPIAMTQTRAALGRPPEDVLTLL